MDKSSFFDFEKWHNYLANDFSCAKLKIESGKNKEKVYVTNITTSSFQFTDLDFVESLSFTNGKYTRKSVLGVLEEGVWEEVRLKVKIPKHFKGKYLIPKGKYRIRVQLYAVDSFPQSKPVVKTFVRSFGRWKKQDFPLPLDKILKEDVNFVLD